MPQLGGYLYITAAAGSEGRAPANRLSVDPDCRVLLPKTGKP
jgi:hypothetical protein